MVGPSPTSARFEFHPPRRMLCVRLDKASLSTRTCGRRPTRPPTPSSHPLPSLHPPTQALSPFSSSPAASIIIMSAPADPFYAARE